MESWNKWILSKTFVVCKQRQTLNSRSSSILHEKLSKDV